MQNSLTIWRYINFSLHLLHVISRSLPSAAPTSGLHWGELSCQGTSVVLGCWVWPCARRIHLWINYNSVNLGWHLWNRHLATYSVDSIGMTHMRISCYRGPCSWCDWPFELQWFNECLVGNFKTDIFHMLTDFVFMTDFLLWHTLSEEHLYSLLNACF